ncbi:hypothetical protein B7760_02058 [Burkholderia glumae]|uniref:hypothetical protein n=1 Tax=Burkholderia glumae TaxID=337 RepID=UPI00157A6047|nr:hypothetical protein [Burkholderia glumae]MCR1769024.1 hypothetical protein [Burkholderia glumae]QKM48024.1 hypothetical protein B7760_02058 [Burkholderia glumae]
MANGKFTTADEVQDTLRLAIGYIGSSERADRHEHVSRIQAILDEAKAANARVIAAARKLIDMRHEETTRDHEIISAIDALDAAIRDIPADAGEAVLTAAARDVLAERRRQVEAEWWTPDHDDEHTSACLAVAAACYSLFAAADSSDSVDSWLQEWRATAAKLWPFDKEWLKTTEPRRDLAKAGALILAEIERLDRAEAREHGAQGGKGGDRG